MGIITEVRRCPSENEAVKDLFEVTAKGEEKKIEQLLMKLNSPDLPRNAYPLKNKTHCIGWLFSTLKEANAFQRSLTNIIRELPDISYNKKRYSKRS